jgi:hypothetical protein
VNHAAGLREGSGRIRQRLEANATQIRKRPQKLNRKSHLGDDVGTHLGPAAADDFAGGWNRSLGGGEAWRDQMENRCSLPNLRATAEEGAGRLRECRSFQGLRRERNEDGEGWSHNVSNW